MPPCEVGRRLTDAGLGTALLERLALGSDAIAELTFDIEAARFGKAAQAIRCDPPVFVAGLARAGTTALLRALFAQRCFATLTFRDMPFLLAPNSWSHFGRGRKTALADRGQEDGILQDLDSPEALEEVFWRVFDRKRYIAADRLRPYEPAHETLKAYRLYVRLILLRYGGTRYLAKNNNNVLRLGGLVRAYPEALLLHPFRDPLQHSASLHHHHLQAAENQRADPSRLRHMNLLAHHEFGLGHRPFAFDETAARGDPAGPDHWLEQWNAAHRFMLDQPETVRRRQIFVDIDSLSADPRAADAFIAKVVSGPICHYQPFRTARQRDLPGLSPVLQDEAREIHTRLKEREGGA